MRPFGTYQSDNFSSLSERSESKGYLNIMRNLSALFFSVLLFLLTSSPALAIQTGVQLPSDTPITENRLINSSFKYNSVKYQYSLGSSQPLEQWIDSAHNAENGGYKVLISLAKNGVGIPQLKNEKTEVSGLYCWYPDELKEVITRDSRGREIGRRPENLPQNNGYQQFMQAMESVGKRLQAKHVEAVEVWNEPNLQFEWSQQGLGPLSPQNYAIFLECGVKGLRKGAGYTGEIISAALAPLSGEYDDIRYFNDLTAAGGLIGPVHKGEYAVSCVGYHGNIVKNIPPQSKNMEGLYRVTAFTQNPTVKSHNLPICMTEFGWSRDLANIDRQAQSKYIVDSFDMAKDWGNIKSMHIWNFGFSKENPDPSFKGWDIEGLRLKQVCLPDQGTKTQRETQYVTTTNLDKARSYTDKIEQALIPGEVRQSKDQDKKTAEPSKVGITKSFLPPISGLFAKICNLSSLPFLKAFAGSFCAPNIVVGASTPANGSEDDLSKQTSDFNSTARLVNKGFVADDVEKQPEQIDCNLVDLGAEADGVQKLKGLSENLGTTTGIFGQELPPKDDAFDQAVDDLGEKENLSIGKKVLPDDRTTTEARLKCDWWVKAVMPEDVAKDYECSKLVK